MLAHGDGAGAGTAGAVRAGERLVDVVVHHVDAEIAGPGDAENGVHVGAVEIDQAARRVHQLGDGRDLLVEQAERVRIGNHEHGRAVVELGLEVVEIDQAAGSLLLMATASNPAMAALAGLVPWALSGMSTRVRASRLRSRK